MKSDKLNKNKKSYNVRQFYNNKALLSQSIANNHLDPMYKIINNISEIYQLLKDVKNSSFQFMYFNRNKIHSILYENEEVIPINSDILEEKMSNYFYFNLLINDNPNIINYIYSINIINEIQSKYNENLIDGKIQDINIILPYLMFQLIKNKINEKT